jgi:hypothetical protein
VIRSKVSLQVRLIRQMNIVRHFKHNQFVYGSSVEKLNIVYGSCNALMSTFTLQPRDMHTYVGVYFEQNNANYYDIYIWLHFF